MKKSLNLAMLFFGINAVFGSNFSNASNPCTYSLNSLTGYDSTIDRDSIRDELNSSMNAVGCIESIQNDSNKENHFNINVSISYKTKKIISDGYSDVGVSLLYSIHPKVMVEFADNNKQSKINSEGTAFCLPIIHFNSSGEHYSDACPKLVVRAFKKGLKKILNDKTLFE